MGRVLGKVPGHSFFMETEVVQTRVYMVSRTAKNELVRGLEGERSENGEQRGLQ
jgi:hypothetical protein